VFVGSVSGMSYLLFAELCLALRVDDPLDAFGVHFGGGIWGLVAACIFAEKGLVYAFAGSAQTSIFFAFMVFAYFYEKILMKFS
jgi:Amt family ammonium transporter